MRKDRGLFCNHACGWIDGLADTGGFESTMCVGSVERVSVCERGCPFLWPDDVWRALIYNVFTFVVQHGYLWPL